MSTSASYDVATAARRMGISTNRVYQLAKDGELSTVGNGPLLLDAAQVDRLRAQALDRFSDVTDSTLNARQRHDGDGVSVLAAEWLRDIAASRELVNESVAKIRRAEEILVDALLRALPHDQR